MVDEIPQFLYYLNTRSIKAPEIERHWFESRLLITDALKNVVAKSKVTLEKQIRIAFSELFEATGDNEITMPLAEIAALVKQPNHKSYVSETLKKMGCKACEYPNTKYFPRFVERKEASGEVAIDIEYVRFKGRYYSFNRGLFINDIPSDLLNPNR